MEVLTAIPKMERDEALEAYAYPEEYRNKIYIFDDQYVYLKTSSYDSFSKQILDIIVNKLIESHLENFKKDEIENESIGMSDEMLKMTISSMISEQIDHIEMPVQPLDTSNVENIVNALFSDKYDQFLNGINARLEEFDNTFTEKLEQRVHKEDLFKLNSGENIPAIVDKQISVHIDKFSKGLRPIVGNLLKEMMPENMTNDLIVSAPTSKISIGTLMALKEAGYSVEEIKQLRHEGLI